MIGFSLVFGTLLLLCAGAYIFLWLTDRRGDGSAF